MILNVVRTKVMFYSIKYAKFIVILMEKQFYN